MVRRLSIVVVYPAGTRLKGTRRVLEDVLGAELDIGDHSPVGDVFACVVGAQLPDGFETGEAKRRIRRALPAVRIKIMERFRESWWRRHRWGIAIGIGGSLAVVLAVELLRPLVARMREALG